MQFASPPRLSVLLVASFWWLMLADGLALAADKVEQAPYANAALRLTCEPNPLQFGRVRLKQSSTLSVNLENPGKTDIVVTRVRRSESAIDVINPRFPFTVGAGKRRKIWVHFKPPAKGSFSGQLTLLGPASNPIVQLPVHGFGVTGSLILTHAPVSFGSVRVGSGKAQYETLRNASSTAVRVSNATVSDNDFSISGLSFPLTLRVGESYTFKTVFRPKSSGGKTASLTLHSNAANAALRIALSGEGTAAGQLNLGPATLDFGNVAVGRSKSLIGWLKASRASVTVSAASLDSAEFVLSGLSLPLTLPPGQSVRFTVKFAPQMSGPASGKISFHSNTNDASVAEILTGGGSVATQHSVTLDWRSGPTKVAGYNVYRSVVSGRQYSRLNPVLDPHTTFTDNTVESGRTYYYVTTAISGTGVESARSNQVEAVIP